MPPDIDITAAQWDIVSTILARYMPHTAVWAFGSRARRTARRFSDLDLAIVAPEAQPFSRMTALENAFADSDLPWSVDVIDYAATSAAFRAIIDQQKVLLTTPA